MSSSNKYNTRQRRLVEDFLCRSGSAHITADALAVALKKDGCDIGRTTVYRTLEKLSEAGRVRKYTAAGRSACYEYIGSSECEGHYHLKCTCCGSLIHLECEKIADILSHISLEHSFLIDRTKTVFYGLCEGCRRD